MRLTMRCSELLWASQPVLSPPCQPATNPLTAPAAQPSTPAAFARTDCATQSSR
jgi:hypothetical protein